jgi:queuine/archaeosine tRNA-ribosyltransferase
VNRFDCVYPTRTARFGVALISTGSIRLKAKEFESQLSPVDPSCRCSTCQHYSRALLHVMFKENNPLASQLLTKHNIFYMMTLMRNMRKTIIEEGKEGFERFVRSFLSLQFPKGNIPIWVVDALQVGAGITPVVTTLSRESNSGENENNNEDEQAIDEENEE